MTKKNAELMPLEASHAYMLFNYDPIEEIQIPVAFTTDKDVAETFIAYGLAENLKDSVFVSKAGSAE